MQHLLTTVADRVGRATGFIQRPTQAKCSAALFAQIMTFTLMADPAPALDAYVHTAATQHIDLSPQALDQRFTAAAATTLQHLVSHALQHAVAAPAVLVPLPQRFPGGVSIQDSSTIVLPAAMATVWPGCGSAGGQGAAALKLQVQFDVLHGQLRGTLTPGRAADQGASQIGQLPAQSLSLADLGYWDVAQFAQLGAAGGWWLSRVPAHTHVQVADGAWQTIAALLTATDAASVDLAVRLTQTHALPVRLLAVRVPDAVAEERRRRLRDTARRKGRTPSAASLTLAAWTVMATNLSAAALSVTEALVLLRLRWQIELLFKLWKQHGQVDALRSLQPWRVVCEVYGRLLAMIVRHWVLLIHGWAVPDRSLVKMARRLSSHAHELARAVTDAAAVLRTLAVVAREVARGCRIQHRKAAPSTIQLLYEPSLLILA
jgi:hypothetical protein